MRRRMHGSGDGKDGGLGGFDRRLQGFCIPPEDIEICTRDDGTEWLLVRRFHCIRCASTARPPQALAGLESHCLHVMLGTTTPKMGADSSDMLSVFQHEHCHVGHTATHEMQPVSW